LIANIGASTCARHFVIITSNMRRFALIALSLTVLATGACLLQPAVAHAGPPNSTTDICGNGPDAAKCDNFVNKYINPAIVLLSAIIGVAAVINIIMAGIQYASSADDPGAVSKAKQRIFNTVVGLVAYAFLFAFLNYLVPGGIL